MAKKRRGDWSGAGAARAARDTRIATVRYIARAAIARDWHKSKLIAAYQVHLAHTGDRAAAVALLFSGMGYQPPFPKSFDEAAELVLTDEARYLAGADLNIVSPHLCDVVTAAAQSLTRADLSLLSADDLPSRSGLVLLPHPILLRSIGGDLADLRAISWHTPSQVYRQREATGTWHPLPAVRMSTYFDSYGPVRPDSFTQYAAYAQARNTPLPPLTLDAIRCLVFQPTHAAEAEATFAKFVNAARQTAGQNRARYLADGLDEDRVEGEYSPGSEVNDHDDTFAPRFLYAFWRLCAQHIANTEALEPNHSARVTAEQNGVAPEVRLASIRQPERAADGDVPAGRDWNHRWVVRMHKVRQWYPSEQRHKILYRGPYVKGPVDKPLLGGEVVRGLIR